MGRLTGDGAAIQRKAYKDITNLLPVRRKIVIRGIRMPRQVELFDPLPALTRVWSMDDEPIADIDPPTSGLRVRPMVLARPRVAVAAEDCIPALIERGRGAGRCVMCACLAGSLASDRQPTIFAFAVSSFACPQRGTPRGQFLQDNLFASIIGEITLQIIPQREPTDVKSLTGDITNV